MSKWQAKNMTQEWFDVEGPIPRIGDQVTMPGDPRRRTVVGVHHQVAQIFHKSKGAESKVTVVLE